MTYPTLILALALAVVLGGPGPCAAQNARALPDFDGLWEEAKRWAATTGTVPEDCVFDFRLDPKTNTPRVGHAVTCNEPYRSPFYPYPESSRPGVRFTADDIRSYARDFEATFHRPSRRGSTSDESLFETCRLIVGFSAAGRGAEAIECHWREGGVLGQRTNSAYLVEKEGGRRVTSRLYDRIAHLRDRSMREIAARVARIGRPDGPRELQIEGQVIGRDGHRVTIRGQARPVFGGSSAEPGVVATDSNLVVEYPSDDALRPGYYFAGQHCFKDKREQVDSNGIAVTVWTYGPCELGSDHYWMFEQYPPGRKTLVHGPYAEYGQCERDRRRTKTGKAIASVGGHCERTAKTSFRMINDGTLIVPKDAAPLD